MPWRVSFEEARRVALGKLPWIRRSLARLERARTRCHEAVEAAGRLDRRSARLVLAERLAALAREHGYLPRPAERPQPGDALGQRLAKRSDPA